MTNIAFLMDPLDSLNLKKDSTLAIIREAQLRDLRVYYFTLNDLVVRQNRPYANFRALQLSDEFISNMDNQSAKEDWYQLTKQEELPLDFMQIIMMRKDPPFDLEYIYATYYLERAEENDTLIVNKPASLRDCNEKFFATAFEDLTPELVISRNSNILKEFFFEHGDVIFKKLDGMGGSQYFGLSKKIQTSM